MNLYQCTACNGHLFVIVSVTMSDDLTVPWHVVVLCAQCGREGENLGLLTRAGEEKP